MTRNQTRSTSGRWQPRAAVYIQKEGAVPAGVHRTIKPKKTYDLEDFVKEMYVKSSFLNPADYEMTLGIFLDTLIHLGKRGIAVTLPGMRFFHSTREGKKIPQYVCTTFGALRNCVGVDDADPVELTRNGKPVTERAVRKSKETVLKQLRAEVPERLTRGEYVSPAVLPNCRDCIHTFKRKPGKE